MFVGYPCSLIFTFVRIWLLFVQQQEKAVAPPSRWAAAETSSSDDEGRVVKSLKDRRWGAMREVIRQMENHMKILDFAELGKGQIAYLLIEFTFLGALGSFLGTW